MDEAAMLAKVAYTVAHALSDAKMTAACIGLGQGSDVVTVDAVTAIVAENLFHSFGESFDMSFFYAVALDGDAGEVD